LFPNVTEAPKAPDRLVIVTLPEALEVSNTPFLVTFTFDDVAMLPAPVIASVAAVVPVVSPIVVTPV